MGYGAASPCADSAAVPRRVTLLATGPLTNIARCLQAYGDEFASRIDRILVMGGAVRVPGNVHQHMLPADAAPVSGAAEWNFYWDAAAARTVLHDPSLSGRIVLFSLDSTNSVPVTEQLVRSLGTLSSVALFPERGDCAARPRPAPLADIAGTCWAMCPWYPREGSVAYQVCAWDVLVAAYLLDPSIALERPERVRVIDRLTGGADEGRVVPCHGASAGESAEWPPYGDVLVAHAVNVERCHDTLRTACRL